MENIIICDDFLSNEEFEKCHSVCEKLSWVPHSSATPDNSIQEILKNSNTDFSTISSMFPNIGKCTTNEFELYNGFWFSDLMKYEMFTKDFLQKIRNTIKKPVELKRVYANGHMFGDNGAFHQDDTEPDTYTFVLYTTKIRDEFLNVAYGQFEIKIPDKKYELSIQPKTNRGVFFPSNYFHRGMSFSRYFNRLRISVAWKLYIPKEEVSLQNIPRIQNNPQTQLCQNDIFEPIFEFSKTEKILLHQNINKLSLSQSIYNFECSNQNAYFMFSQHGLDFAYEITEKIKSVNMFCYYYLEKLENDLLFGNGEPIYVLFFKKSGLQVDSKYMECDECKVFKIKNYRKCLFSKTNGVKCFVWKKI